MSISASFIVLAVLILRIPLKKAPKWITVLLWGIAAIRLICPFSIESVISLIPSAETVSPQVLTGAPAIDTGIPVINNAINPVVGEPAAVAAGDEANVLKLFVTVFSKVWLLGVAVMLAYAVVSFVRIKRKIGTAVLLEGNVYQSENVASPFIVGIIRPKIYLPFKLDGRDRDHVLSHERAHIVRKDHLWKPFGFLILSLHWFNPLVWAGFILLCRDIELACDEKVVKSLDGISKADYSEALLNCSIDRRTVAACPLAFGEVGVKERVRSVLNYKKPPFWIIVTAIVLCVAVAVCFLTTSPKKKEKENKDDEKGVEIVYNGKDVNIKINETELLKEQYPEFFGLDAEKGLYVYIWQFSKNSYSCYLTDTEESPASADGYLFPHGVPMRAMRTVIDSYGVGKDKVTLCPVHNLTSSYLYAIDKEYREKLETMFWSTTPQGEWDNIYDTAVFDVDGDGKDEVCSMSVGPTSGLFTFVFSAREGENIEYSTVIYSKWYSLSFFKDEDGTVKVKGITKGEKPETHIFDIAVKSGDIVLTENGVPIGEIP